VYEQEERTLLVSKPATVSMGEAEENTLMQKDNVVHLEDRITAESKLGLEDVLREGARRLLQDAIENEGGEYVARHSALREETGHHAVVRNGYLPERNLVTGLGPVRVKQPRVRDRREGDRFTSKILPPFMRRVPSIDALIPVLYLKGISTGDFSEALEAILGPNAAGLSATNIVRLKEGWQQDYEAWSKRDLAGKRYVYWWADGIYFNVRLEPDRPCMLVLMGTLDDGTKELLAVHDGQRESKESWLEVLHELRARGLSEAPKLAVGDGALGFWAALEESFPKTREQRCWVHKTANLLDKLPKRAQPHAKKLIHEMYLSATRADALNAYNRFLEEYEAKYPKAAECLKKDKDLLFTFYDFPAEHWAHLRTTNPIESTFATVRHRTRQTKGCGSRMATLTMVFKLSVQAQKHWRRLNGYQLIPKVIEGVPFIDGVLAKAA
jgi:transposase-like protein